MGIIGWIIIGGLAGWIASKIMNTDEQQGGQAVSRPEAACSRAVPDFGGDHPLR